MGYEWQIHSLFVPIRFFLGLFIPFVVGLFIGTWTQKTPFSIISILSPKEYIALLVMQPILLDNISLFLELRRTTRAANIFPKIAGYSAVKWDMRLSAWWKDTNPFFMCAPTNHKIEWYFIDGKNVHQTWCPPWVSAISQKSTKHRCCGDRELYGGAGPSKMIAYHRDHYGTFSVHVPCPSLLTGDSFFLCCFVLWLNPIHTSSGGPLYPQILNPWFQLSTDGWGLPYVPLGRNLVER